MYSVSFNKLCVECQSFEQKHNLMTLIVVSGNPIRVCILLASMFFVYIFHGPRCTTPKPCNASIKACGRSGGPLAGLFLLLLERGGDTWH